MIKVDEKGFYGKFGGHTYLKCSIPILKSSGKIMSRLLATEEFQKEFRLLEGFVGRPTPLYFASRLV
jgi:tryptophan synthase beta chain